MSALSARSVSFGAWFVLFQDVSAYFGFQRQEIDPQIITILVFFESIFIVRKEVEFDAIFFQLERLATEAIKLQLCDLLILPRAI